LVEANTGGGYTVAARETPRGTKRRLTMDMKTILATFGLIFLAELGDKTQLGVLLFASKSGREGFPWEVCLGASAALIVTTVIAAALGYAGKELIPSRVIHYVAAAGFVGVGIWMFFSKA